VIFEEGEEAPWVTAGIVASFLMIASVFAREVILRNARNRYLANRRRLDRNFTRWAGRYGEGASPNKLSLRQHDRIMEHIVRKSQAARVLSDLAEGHREVFAVCDDYLSITASELRKMDVNSPRYGAFRKGRTRVKKIHQFHLLAWTEIESKELLREAGAAESFSQRVEISSNALQMVENALVLYPSDNRLLESAQALREYISAVNVGDRFAEAEKQESEGRIAEAIDRYEAILGQLPAEHFGEDEMRLLSERVASKLEELRSRSGGQE
jgi:hypothetical protein